MKLVLLSGAGLSAGSGIPTYQETTMSEEFKDFFSASETQALQILHCNTLKCGHWLEINLNEEIYYVIKTH